MNHIEAFFNNKNTNDRYLYKKSIKQKVYKSKTKKIRR